MIQAGVAQSNTSKKKRLSKFIFFLENNVLIEMTYTTVGVKLVGVAQHGARFVVLKHPLV